MRMHPDYEIAFARYRGGKSLAEAADGICSTSALHKKMVRLRLPRRRPGATIGARDKARLKQIVVMRRQGMTFAGIAEKFGLSRQAVHQYLAYHSAAS